MSEPLWTDDTIIERYKTAFGKSPDVHHMAMMTWMRDELQARIAELEERIKRLGAQLIRAESELADIDDGGGDE